MWQEFHAATQWLSQAMGHSSQLNEVIRRSKSLTNTLERLHNPNNYQAYIQNPRQLISDGELIYTHLGAIRKHLTDAQAIAYLQQAGRDWQMLMNRWQQAMTGSTQHFPAGSTSPQPVESNTPAHLQDSIRTMITPSARPPSPPHGTKVDSEEAFAKTHVSHVGGNAPSPSPEAAPETALDETTAYVLSEELKRDKAAFLEKYLVPALGHRFNELQFVSQGGMGFIVSAYDKRLTRRVALKFLLDMADIEQQVIFDREAKAAARVGHEGIIEIFDFDQAFVPIGKRRVGIPYQIYEFIENGVSGKDLFRRHAEKGEAVPFDTAIDFILQAAEALEAAHEKDLVHRDIKGDNLLMDDSTGRVKVLDFGLATKRKEALRLAVSQENVAAAPAGSARESDLGNGDFSLSEGPNRVFGTLSHVPPEGFFDPQNAGKPWDVYSLGIELYRLLTGQNSPLPYTTGADPKRLGAHALSYMGYLPSDGSPQMEHGSAVASPKKGKALGEKKADPSLRTLQKEKGGKEALALLHGMTRLDDKQRFTIKRVVRALKNIQKMRSSGERSRRKAMGIAGVVSVGLLGALAAMPMISSSRARSAFESTHAQQSKAFEDERNKQNWAQAVVLLEAEIARIKESEYADEADWQMKLKKLEDELKFAGAMEKLETLKNQVRELNGQIDTALQESGSALTPRLPGTTLEGDEVMGTLSGTDMSASMVSLRESLQELKTSVRARPDDQRPAMLRKAEELGQDLDRAERRQLKAVASYAFQTNAQLALRIYQRLSALGDATVKEKLDALLSYKEQVAAEEASDDPSSEDYLSTLQRFVGGSSGADRAKELSAAVRILKRLQKDWGNDLLPGTEALTNDVRWGQIESLHDAFFRRVQITRSQSGISGDPLKDIPESLGNLQAYLRDCLDLIRRSRESGEGNVAVRAAWTRMELGLAIILGVFVKETHDLGSSASLEHYSSDAFFESFEAVYQAAPRVWQPDLVGQMKSWSGVSQNAKLREAFQAFKAKHNLR